MAAIEKAAKEQAPDLDALKAQMARNGPGFAAFLEATRGEGADEKSIDGMFQLDEMTARMARPILARMKADFLRKTAELNEKRLELAEVERRYQAID